MDSRPAKVALAMVNGLLAGCYAVGQNDGSPLTADRALINRAFNLAEMFLKVNDERQEQWQADERKAESMRQAANEEVDRELAEAAEGIPVLTAASVEKFTESMMAMMVPQRCVHERELMMAAERKDRLWHVMMACVAGARPVQSTPIQSKRYALDFVKQYEEGCEQIDKEIEDARCVGEAANKPSPGDPARDPDPAEERHQEQTDGSPGRPDNTQPF